MCSLRSSPWRSASPRRSPIRAREFASSHRVHVVLKGHRTIIAGPEGRTFVNLTGNAGMATGGTGDILTGMVAGMLAQHPESPFRAVLAAVYLHGLAGDIACYSGSSPKGEQSLVATDLVRALPDAVRGARHTAGERWIMVGGQASGFSRSANPQ